MKEAQGNRYTADDDLQHSKLETNKQNIKWIAQPIIDYLLTKIYALLTKRDVKMAGYWP